jgi:hypothetical protein
MAIYLGRGGFIKISIALQYFEIWQHFQLAVGAGSPTALKGANRLNKPVPTHKKAPERYWFNISLNLPLVF